MNLSPDWIKVFSKYDIEAVHWSSIGDPRAADRTIMIWAQANGYVVFTHDLDFSALLAATQASSPSVIQVRTQDVLPASLEKLVTDAIAQFSSLLASGALITIDRTRSRVRILPLT